MVLGNEAYADWDVDQKSFYRYCQSRNGTVDVVSVHQYGAVAIDVSFWVRVFEKVMYPSLM
jgi:hypothetical protein